VPPPRGVAGLLALVAGRAGTGPPPPGRVDVAAVRTSDAEGRPRTAYVVALPGTTDWSPPGRAADPAHVRTLQANLQLMSGNATAEVAALPAALAAAGVPAGATVVLVGHSQGGMTARAAAADPRLLARYRVGAVLTAGSPTGAMAAPAPGVPVLALEHADDIVPALDGRRNLDGESRSTVTFAPADGPTEPGARALDLPAPGAHDLDGYIAAAARVEQDRDWRLTTFAGRLRELGVAAPDASGPGGATATITRVELRLAPA
jgi:pimeloyl-ACP methyl ester carboxylesterase